MSDVHANAGAPPVNPAVVANPTSPAPAPTTQQPPPAPQPSNGAAPIAAGGSPAPTTEPPPYWPEGWREKMAEHASAGDKKAYEKELARLQRMATPNEIYGSFRGMENTWATKKFVRLPGDDAKPEEVAEFNKSLGAPETHEDYLKNAKLENGAVLGDADKALAGSFAEHLHKVGAPQKVYDSALSWYLGHVEKQAADLDAADEANKTTTNKVLREEWGPRFERKRNSVGPLFETAPGGADVKNPGSLMSRLLGGRTADGKLIGDDADVVRWLVSIAQDRNPAAAVVEEGAATSQTVDNEIAALEKRMRTDRDAYFKDEKAQARYRELLEARTRIQARR